MPAEKNVPATNEPILVLDIETISIPHQEKKFSFSGPMSEQEIESRIIEHAALTPLTGRVWFIGLRRVSASEPAENIIFSSDGTSEGEKLMLKEFSSFVWRNYGSFLRRNKLWWTGHNVVGFDIPFLKNRAFHLGCPENISPLFPGTGWASKPWENTVIDIYRMWKSITPPRPPVGEIRGFGSLQTICAQLNIPVQTDALGGDMDNCFMRGEEGWAQAKEHLELDLIQEEMVFKRLFYYSQ